jgi:rSAM/selenodomain-associated transferase 2
VKVSFVIPVLNEAEWLPRTLHSISDLCDLQSEVIVVDGGSEDTSVECAIHAGAHVLKSQRGRARQMNLGAAQATGQFIVFVHADTLLPPGVGRMLSKILNHQIRWGFFKVHISGQSALLPLISFLINLRSKLTGIATGDQVIFIERTLFHTLGGFPDQPLMEDVEITKRLKRYATPTCLPVKVITSGRRWDRYGAWHTVFLMWRLRFAYWRGVPAEELATLYP